MKSLKEIYLESEENNYIDPNLYTKHKVKAGLRNENGTGIKVGLTKICDVIGYKEINNNKIDIDGKLIYRGYPVDKLVELSPYGYEKTAFLLIFGKMPSDNELNIFKEKLLSTQNICQINPNYHTTNILNALQIEVLKLYGLDENPDQDRLAERMIKGLSILSMLPLITFSFYHRQQICTYPLPNRSLAENILVLSRKAKTYTKQEARLMDALLILHADHGGGNNSTFANVVISSTGTDIYSCISAAIGSLKGPRHGGANSKVSKQAKEIFKTVGISNDENKMEDIAIKILDKEFFDNSGLIYGIGHAIYTKSDPRCQIIKKECRKLALEKGMIDKFNTLETFERAALKIMKEKKGISTCTNIDFYSGFAYSMLEIDESLYTPLFCISRCAGWIAHHLENRQSNRKLIRPANVYVGN